MFGRKRKWLPQILFCESGVSAVEFALIAPVMITTYFGASELCNLLLCDRKVTNVTAATTDLVAQALQVSDANIADIFTASSAIMEPYPLASLQIIVTSAVADADGNVTVGWSDGYNTPAHMQGTAFTLPDGLIQPGGSVIVTEVRYTYDLPIGEFWTDGFTVNDTFYQRPRRVMQIIRHS